ncbi:MAG TPA: glycosyltransferase family 39 protein [Pyrinomonadaceae bacterium]|nr:glycosyltransferase family 39 protein [Pyrinomonadaceae bacterium]
MAAVTETNTASSANKTVGASDQASLVSNSAEVSIKNGPARTVVIVLLALLVVLAFALRARHLGAIGFAEDEVNKVDALQAYERGDISANAEHPMLMKAMMFASLKVGNALAASGRQVSPETLLRFPNAVFGALTVIPLFMLTAAFFDRWTGLIAAAFWAAGVNAITYNRIGKEDTLMVFFMLFAFYFYLRAKQTDTRKVELRRRNYLLSAVSWGLMLASKYFPNYFGVNQLYHHNYHVRTRQPGEPPGATPRIFYIALVVAFIVFNPPVLLPQVWHYLNAYMGEKLLVHTGYLFADQLYRNNVSRSPFWGTPMYFYLVFMAIKIPLAVLISFVAGFVVSVKRRKQPAYGFVLVTFLLWIVPYSLIGAKWLRYTLSLMPFVYMISAVGVMEIFKLLAGKLNASAQMRTVLAAVLLLGVVGWPTVIAFSAGPHYGLYTNALGGGKVGYFFPHDEFYDDGLREAIRFVCDNAPPGAVIAQETPATTHYYLGQFQRQDLNAKAISSPDFDAATVSAPAYFILQRGRTYFENQDKLRFIRSNFKMVHEVQVNGLTAAEVFVK